MASAEDKNQDQGASTTTLKAVVHVNFADPERQEDALENIENILKDALVSEVTTVPSGAVEVLRKQQEGYGYFKP